VENLIVLGSTGMLGQALIEAAKFNNYKTIGVARTNADINLDVLNFNKLTSLIESEKPKIIINCVAITNIDECEQNPEKAYLVNTYLVKIISDICEKLGVRLIHISTDHFFIGDKGMKHSETALITLINNYAKTKYDGERFALNNSSSLIVRTNIVGFRNKGKPTFIEWVLLLLKQSQEVIVFQDFYTSSIDVYQFSEILFKVIDKGNSINGLINIASSEVSNKEQFIKKFASVFGLNNSKLVKGSVMSINGTKRAESLGLDTNKIESLLSIKMPTLNEVIKSLYKNKYV
jgi:dTDP-4-dehydrorhamnose reductase